MLDKLLTIVPLSTVKSDPIQPYHYLLPKKSMPMIGIFQERESWVKGDMCDLTVFQELGYGRYLSLKAFINKNIKISYEC